MKFTNQSLAVVMVWGFIVSAAQAAPITYEFHVEATSGPLTGAMSTGVFMFDENIVPVGGGRLDDANLFTGLNFTWNSTSYDETTANTATLVFDPAGALVIALFGNKCIAGRCELSAHGDWIFIFAQGFGVDFRYTFDFAHYSDNTGQLTGPVAPVPEPTIVLLVGLGGVAVLRQRSRHSK